MAEKANKRLESLPHLPTELVEQIFSDVTDTKTLASVCRVSKLGKRVATPLLYHSLGIADESLYTGDKNLCGRKTTRKARSLQLQCRTLIENRELGKHVAEIRQYMNDHVFRHQHGMRIIPPKKCRRVLSKDIELPPRVVNAIMDGLSDEDSTGQTDEAYFVLLLALCPQVTVLRLEGGVGVMRALPRVGTTLRTVYEITQDRRNEAYTRPASGIYTIQKIHLTSLGDRRRLGAEDLVPLLQLPALQYVTADCLHPSISKGSGSNAFFVDSSVKTISIEQCFAKDEDLEALFMACPNAESLTIEWGSRQDNYRRFDWSQIGDLIMDHMPNLKHLSFDHYADLDPNERNTEEMMAMMDDDFLKSAHLPGLGSLKDLEQLETLSLSNIALFGTHNDDEFRPQELGFNDDDDDYQDVEKHTLETLLPDSLKELTGKNESGIDGDAVLILTSSVLCEGLRFSTDDRALLDHPRAARLQNMTIKTCMQNHWISTRDGEHRISPSTGRPEAVVTRPYQNVRRPPPERIPASAMGTSNAQSRDGTTGGPGEETRELPIEMREHMFEVFMADAVTRLPAGLVDQFRSEMRREMNL